MGTCTRCGHKCGFFDDNVIISVSVLGQVLGIDKAHGHLRVSGIKVANLSNLANLEVLKGMWSNEVAEAHQIDNMKIL